MGLLQRLMFKVRGPEEVGSTPDSPELTNTQQRIAELENRLVAIDALDLEIDVTVRRRHPQGLFGDSQRQGAA